MKMQVYRGEKEWGTVELVNPKKVNLEGDKEFKAFIKKLKQKGVTAEAFVKSLPTRLRSYISAVEVSNGNP